MGAGGDRCLPPAPDEGMRSVGPSAKLWSSLGLSAALHAGLLAAVGDASLHTTAPALEQGATGALKVRLTADSVRTGKPDAVIGSRNDSAGGHGADREPQPPGGDSAASLGEIALGLPDEFRERDYLPRSVVSVPAQPSADIILPFPDDAPDSGTRRAILFLFIDDSGHVARVRVVDSQLSQALEEAAQAAFLQSRFRPAEKDGRAVKSLVRVEVTFSRPSGP